jgi:hypothetical protein
MMLRQVEGRASQRGEDKVQGTQVGTSLQEGTMGSHQGKEKVPILWVEDMVLLDMKLDRLRMVEQGDRAGQEDRVVKEGMAEQEEDRVEQGMAEQEDRAE